MILSMFVSKSDEQEYMRTPFLIDDYVCATNGHWFYFRKRGAWDVYQRCESDLEMKIQATMEKMSEAKMIEICSLAPTQFPGHCPKTVEIGGFHFAMRYIAQLYECGIRRVLIGEGEGEGDYPHIVTTDSDGGTVILMGCRHAVTD